MSLPAERTNKQPIVWRCFNPECFDEGQRVFDFERESPKCPKCGAEPPFIAARSLIHLLVRDADGPILGEFGRRYKVACDPKRNYLATLGNQEAATGDVRAANCPGCLAAVGGAPIISGHVITATG